MKFQEIIGQEEVKKYLIQTVTENRVSHAQLFYGPPSSGKLALAVAYAQYICCANKSATDSCGECASCRKYAKLIHPDLHFVFPVISAQGKSSISDTYIESWRLNFLSNPYITLNEWLECIGAENKQGSIYAEEAREILHKLNLKTFEAEYKVMIIWLPERMNNSTANKLLKMLEEPPDKTLFVLVADNHEEILPTILSRTLPVKIPRIDNKSLSEALVSKFGINTSEAREICNMSEGNYLEAVNHINTSEELVFYFEKFVALMRQAYSRNIYDLVKWVGEIAGTGREKQKSLMEYSLRMIRGNFLINNSLPEMSFLVKRERDFSERFSAYITPNNVEKIAEAFEKAAYHIERNGNARIILTDLCFTMMALLKAR
ncbi:MAG: DNA polymerase III subunit delta [Bacteroidales bacterium]|nr:DNA polymerase III subunit delta [Bacteroidales bacterium]HOY37673.1 DNA polymerase III subunit delta [Bacteroidales bacterium]HQP04175.1 DNA polymerase III subunit delta [Bacteroidales bacterium]